MLVTRSTMAAATTDEHESHGTHMGFTGICSLCDYQFTSNATAFGSYAKSSLESDSSGGSEPDAEDALRVFLADKNERSVRLVLCRSCREQLDQLLETGRQLSLLVDLVTTLLLQNSRFTLIHPKETIIAKLFSDNNLQHYFSSSRLPGLDPLSMKDVELEPESYEMKNSVSLTDNMSDIDREIHELETQFHLDRIKVYKYQEGNLHSEDDNQHETPSLCSSLPSLVSLDSCSFAHKDPLGNNIMNVNISALESSGSDGFGHSSLSKPPKAKTSPIKNHTSITNLIANTTNDELDVCFSNRIQKMKESNTEETSDEGSKRAENVFRLPLPPSTASTPPEKETDKSRKTVKKATKNRQHMKVKKRFACDMCPKTWESKRDLDVHVGSHLKVSNFVCEICGMAYRHKSALKTHVALHQGEAKYKCDKCQKHFTQKSGLERHEEAIHSSARNYECTDCGRTFRYHSSFNLHKEYHKETPNKKFRCQVGKCGQSFFTSYHLKRHLKTHASDTAQKCKVQDSSVNSNSEANNFCETSAQ